MRIDIHSLLPTHLTTFLEETTCSLLAMLPFRVAYAQVEHCVEVEQRDIMVCASDNVLVHCVSISFFIGVGIALCTARRLTNRVAAHEGEPTSICGKVVTLLTYTGCHIAALATPFKHFAFRSVPAPARGVITVALVAAEVFAVVDAWT